MLQNRFSRKVLLIALVATLMVMIPSAAFAGPRVGIGVGYWGGWGGWGGPYYAWGPYPYAYGYYPYGYGYYGRPLGEIQIKSPDSNAQIYINGALAGRAHDLKRFYLAPGTYNVEQHIGNDVQKERIYVIADRTLKLEFGKAGTGTPQPAAPPAPAPNANAAPQPTPAPEAQRPQ